MQQGIRIAAGMLLALAMTTATASSRAQRSFDEMQAAYVAAIRWSDFDSAWEMVDPAWREVHPQSDLERERYQQVQISGYREVRASSPAAGEIVREVELRVINKNTQAERVVRVHETWHWDAEHKRWWLTSGLPDLWRGE